MVVVADLDSFSSFLDTKAEDIESVALVPTKRVRIQMVKQNLEKVIKISTVS